MKNIVSVLTLASFVAACTQTPSQSQYNYNEVGQAITIEYALVVAAKQVDITGNSAAAPAALGGPPASISGELGGVWQTAGAAVQQAETDKKGYEYTVVTESKATKTLVQYQNPKDVVFSPSDIVMLQETGTFHRLLTTANLPDRIIAPHKRALEALYAEAPPAIKPTAVEPAPIPVSVSEPKEKPPEPSSATLPLPAPAK